MEKVYKLPFCNSQEGVSARTNFNTPVSSTLCSSRERFFNPFEHKTSRPFHCRADSSNLTQNHFLKVRPEPLRSTQEKFLRHSESIHGNCHKQKSPKPNYSQQGKIIHREVNWIIYNICNCMVSLWVKNERTLQGLQQHFNLPKEMKLDLTFEPEKQQKAKKLFSTATISQKSQSLDKDCETKGSFEKIFGNLGGAFFSSILDADPIRQEEEVKQVIDLIFSQKPKQLPKGQTNSDCFKVTKKVKKQKQQKSKNIYKFLLEQNDSNQAVKKISQRNENVYPILMDFSRKILMKKENILIEKLLKNQKLDDFILDSMKFEDKVNMYESILIKRMDDFKVLKQSLIKLTANTEKQMQLNKKLISQFISKGHIKYSTNKNVLMKSISFDEVLSLINNKVMNAQSRPSNQQIQNFLKLKNLHRNASNRSSGQSRNKYSSRQLQLGINSVNIQFGQQPQTSDLISPLKLQQETNKLIHKIEKPYFPNFQDVVQKSSQILIKQKRHLPKRLKSIKNPQQNEPQFNPNLRTPFETKKNLDIEKNLTKNIKKQINNFKHKQSIASFKSQQQKGEKKHQTQAQDEKPTPKNYKNHENSNFKPTERNMMRSLTSKKKLETTDSPKRNFFLKNKRKGINFSPFPTKQFLKFLHDRNLSKFSEMFSQIINNESENNEPKEKSKFFTTDNSPTKNKGETLTPTQKIIKGSTKRQRKDSEKNIRKKMQKRQSNNAKQQNQTVISLPLSESESKTASKLRRLKFQGQNLLHHKIIEKILKQINIDKQKNSYIVRDKMIGYFNRLLESGMFDQEGLLSEHKENVQSLIRNYDQKRRNAKISKSLPLGQKNEDEKNPNQFHINVKLRNNDPQIFERLKDIHTGLKNNPEPLMFQKPLINNDLLNEELNDIKRNHESSRRNSNAEFDLEFNDFFSPLLARYDDDGAQDGKEMRDSKDDEYAMLEFMKQLIKKSYFWLGQKQI